MIHGHVFAAAIAGLVLTAFCAGCTPVNDVARAVETDGVDATAPWNPASEFTQERERRDRQIRAESVALRDHPWAGSYFYGDGLGVNVSGNLAPAAGYTFTNRGCLGLYEEDYGSVEQHGQRLFLSSALAPGESRRSFATELVVVTWGDEVFLVPPHAMLRFVNGVNAGSHPNMFLRRDGALPLVLEEHTKPDLPEPWGSRVLDHPLTAEVVSVGAPRPEAIAGTIDGHVSTVTLDKGSDAGVFPGMRLHLLNPKPRWDEAEITSTTKTTSRADIAYPSSASSPEIGWRYSSRYAWLDADAPK